MKIIDVIDLVLLPNKKKLNTQYGCSRRPFRRNRAFGKNSICSSTHVYTHTPSHKTFSLTYLWDVDLIRKRAYTPNSHREMTITPSTTVTLYNTILPGHQKYSRTLFMTFYESTVSPKKISSPLESTFLSSPQYKIPTRLLLSPSFFLRLLQQNTTLTVLQQI